MVASLNPGVASSSYHWGGPPSVVLTLMVGGPYPA